MLRQLSRLPPTIQRLLSPATPLTTEAVQVNGWIKSIRKQKKVSFAVVTDGSSARGIQAVFTDALLTQSLTNGTSVSLIGQLVQSRGSEQPRELQVNKVHVLGTCDPVTYPVQKQSLTVEYMRENAHLRARQTKIAAMLRLRHSLQNTLHDHFKDEGFCYVHTPIITANDCEGAGEAFRLALRPSTSGPPEEFFSTPSYLTVSSQLHLEAVASAISRVYTLSPCFRAERSQTNRHLAEFWMLEAECAFISELDEVCDIVERSLKATLQSHSLEDNPDMQSLWKDGNPNSIKMLESAASSKPWTRMTYTDAVFELEKNQASTRAFRFEPKWGSPLQSEHEKWLAEELVQGPVFVTDYPTALKPFYMRLNDDKKTVACFDLLVPQVGELAGGSLREERLDYLDAAISKHKLSPADYSWYTDLRRFGGAPHGGYGMGFERLVGWLGGIENVRECISMPRWSKRMLL